ncbi:MFS transporter [Pseudonocardia endophytica]|uniref:Sugar phosphate permease n=1 Tax=Pseudonocardia endophytica TaxID=401976 RepID=A0A4R1I7Y1_PSEEN|nr:MFS transporter [Pseudonocardia endophytica]TCK26242.1 sugar phosphate permease [Pseudonocardia endophytica]
MSRRRVLLGAMLLDLAVSPLFAWDVFTASLQRDLGAGPTALTSVFSVGLAAFTTGVLVGGRIADSIAPRRMALVAAVGTVAGLLGSAAAASVLVMVLAFGIVLGGTTGLGYATAVRVAGTFTTGRGLALGLVVSAYAIGTAILAPVAAALLDGLGRSWTFVLLAAVLGILLVVAAVLLPAEAATAPTVETGHDDRRTPRGQVAALWLAFGLGSAPALAAFARAGPLAGSTAAAAAAVTLLNVGNFVGRLVAGPASDRWGRRATLHANSALLVVACIPLAAGVDGPPALVALFLLGTQYGALSTLTPAAVSDVVPTQRFGAVYGRVFSGWGIAGLLAPVVASAIAAVTGFGIVYAGFIVVAAVSWLCVALYARSARDGRAPTR